MRKHFIMILNLLLCLPLFAYSDSRAEYYDYSFARMSYVTGDVFIERASDMGYEQGTVNLPIVENDKLGTRDGRAEIHFGRKNYLRIDGYSQVDFAGLPMKGYDKVKLNLLSGNIYLRVNFLGREKDFEVHTPDASFYILEEGLYGIRVVENKETEIHVVDGAAEAAGQEGSVLVESEERLVASDGAFLLGPEYLYTSYSDSFSEWNNSRDALLSRAVQKAYLPAELYEYESELAANGQWVYETSYGYVWVPHVYHHTWRPYHYGRWLWYPVCGWTWVPYATWGWCVSHYGRWHWRFGLGWYWIPTCSWSPAWVYWHWGYDYISWCPMSYWGYPVVIQHNTFYGRWNDRYYPVGSRALTVIHKNQLQAPRISRVALSQSQANRLGKISLSAKQPGVKAVIQRNSLTSQKASSILARSNIRKVGRGYSSARISSSALRSHTAKITGQFQSKRSALTKSGQVGAMKNSVSRPSSQTSAKSFSSRSANWKSSRTADSDSSQRTRIRSAIKTYPSRTISSGRSISSVTGQTSRSRVTYPSSTNTGESVRSYSGDKYNNRNSSSQTTGIKSSSYKDATSSAIKVYPSRSSYSSGSSIDRERSRYSSSLRTTKKSSSSYSSASRSSRPSRYSSFSERSRVSSSYRSSSPDKASSSFRSTPSFKSHSSSNSSSRSSSGGRVSSRSSSSSASHSRSYSKSSRSSSSSRHSSGKVSSSRGSSQSKARTSSGSRSSKSVSKSSARVKRK